MVLRWLLDRGQAVFLVTGDGEEMRAIRGAAPAAFENTWRLGADVVVAQLRQHGIDVLIDAFHDDIEWRLACADADG